jgi:cell division septation protein DedD
LDSRVLIVEHEFFETFVGCCVNDGIAVIVDTGDRAKVDSFAKENHCRTRAPEDAFLPPEVLAAVRRDTSSLAVELSCKYTDLESATNEKAGESENKLPASSDEEGSTAETAPAQEEAGSPKDLANGFAVQIAAPPREQDANVLRDAARDNGFESFVQPVDTDGGRRYRVRIGPVSSREKAEVLRAEVSQKLGMNGVIVIDEPGTQTIP